MLSLRGYLKISPKGYCTFSVVFEGNGCQESLTLQNWTIYSFSYLLICRIFCILTRTLQFLSIRDWNTSLRLLIWAAPCRCLWLLTEIYCMALILWTLFQNGTWYPKGTTEIAFFRQCMGRFGGLRPSAHSYSFFCLPPTNWTWKMQVENVKWGTVPQILLWSSGALFGAAGTCFSLLLVSTFSSEGNCSSRLLE